MLGVILLGKRFRRSFDDRMMTFGCLINMFMQEMCNIFFTIIDYSKGFGGKYGVQKDRMDKVLWSNHYITHTDYISVFLTWHSEQEIRLWKLCVCVHFLFENGGGCLSVSAAWWWWFLGCFHQSAGTFEEVEKPSAAYQKTRPIEAGQNKDAFSADRAL